MIDELARLLANDFILEGRDEDVKGCGVMKTHFLKRIQIIIE